MTITGSRAPAYSPRLVLGGVACLTALVVGAASAEAAPQPGATTERAVRSLAPDAAKVHESHIRIYDPLPAGSADHPARCDWLGYLRFRDRKGPRNAKRADAVVALIPGFLGGAKSFDQLARNIVRNAAKRGKHVEVWAIDRRANCLEDRRGIRAAARQRDATIAYEYYWGNRAIRGKRFAGFVDPTSARFLSSFGLARTMRDWHTVLTSGLPGQRRRARKLICGGHSLGGPLTAAFASWDFDGDPATTRDAGYRQCRGLIGLDTSVALAEGGDGSALGPAFVLDGLGDANAAEPYINAPPLTPETIQVPNVFGVAAYFDPEGTDALAELPHSANIDLSQRVLFSRDAANFATGRPSIRDFKTTNELTLAGIFDDNSAPESVSFIRASVGSVRPGDPLTDKNFPAPDGTTAIPADTSHPLYRWQSYRAVGRGGSSLALNDAGEPYTSRHSEASSLRQLARTLFESPVDFTERYFPTRLMVDVIAAGGGDRSGSLAGLAHDGPGQRPILLIQAGDSDENSGPDEGPEQRGEDPNGLRGSAEWIVPGYNHLDVLTAHRRQNDRCPEPTAKRITRFVFSLTGKPPRSRSRPPGGSRTCR